MINYYFYHFIKKIRLDRALPVGVRPPGANGGTDSVFSNLNRLESARVDRAGPWIVRVWTGPDQTVFKSLPLTNEQKKSIKQALSLSKFKTACQQIVLRKI
jgi:hypothetical protein